MDRNVLGLLISFAFVGGVLVVAAGLKRLGVLRGEGARKFVHIASAHWVLVALWFFDDLRWALVAPGCFVAVNYLSWRFRLIKVIEREDGDKSAGTVFYAASVLACTAFGYWVGKPYLAACGVLAMGWGDGLAALVGRKWGKSHLPAPFARKTLLGSAAALGASFVCVFVVWMAADGHVGAALGAACVCAVAAALLELVDAHGLDNVTVPVGVTLAAYSYAVASFVDLRIITAATLLIVCAAWAAGQLTAWGAVCALFVGQLIYIGGGGWAYAALVGFFVLSAIAGRLTDNARKREAEALHARKGARGAVQALANGLPPVAFALAYRWTGEAAWLYAAYGALAAACADTFSSEFGMAYGRKPFNILTRKPVAPGLSGGVSAAGLLGGFVGAWAMALFAVSTFGVSATAVMIAGFAGAVADSVLGAAIQAKYQSAGGLTEIKNGHAVAGLPFINNDAVNFLAVTLGGLACAGLSLLGR